MKKDFHKFNKAFRVFTLLVLMTGLPFHCLEIRLLVQVEGKFLSKTMTGIYLIVTVASLYMAAQGNYNLDKVRNWLAVNNNVEKLSSKKLMLLLHELSSSDNIGLQGGKFFTITYRLILSVAGIIVTYSVIILQWNDKK
ncbi:uncharacterized protein LOC118436654 [Folsomia candida]|nr:uncharacterized protein LOC118436654 [Folsomia candida]